MKKETLRSVRDVRAVRLIVPDIPSCYAGAGSYPHALAADPW